MTPQQEICLEFINNAISNYNQQHISDFVCKDLSMEKRGTALFIANLKTCGQVGEKMFDLYQSHQSEEYNEFCKQLGEYYTNSGIVGKDFYIITKEISEEKDLSIEQLVEKYI